MAQSTRTDLPVLNGLCGIHVSCHLSLFRSLFNTFFCIPILPLLVFMHHPFLCTATECITSSILEIAPGIVERKSKPCQLRGKALSLIHLLLTIHSVLLFNNNNSDEKEMKSMESCLHSQYNLKESFKKCPVLQQSHTSHFLRFIEMFLYNFDCSVPSYPIYFSCVCVIPVIAKARVNLTCH